MDIENIITELEKEQKVITQASKNIDKLLKELRLAPFGDYDYVTVKTASEKKQYVCLLDLQQNQQWAIKGDPQGC